MMKQVLSFLRSNAVGLIFIALGLAGGYLYYRLTLCASGTCPLTSTPCYSMLVGGLMGALAGDLLSALRARLTSRSSQ